MAGNSIGLTRRGRLLPNGGAFHCDRGITPQYLGFALVAVSKMTPASHDTDQSFETNGAGMGLTCSIWSS